jgi:hypothetical protein
MIDDIPSSPLLTNESPSAAYERAVLDWVQAAVIEGEKVLQAEPAYAEIDKAIAYLMGDQLDTRRPADLSRVVDNRLKHVTLQNIAGLTDVHPLFGFKTFNPQFQNQNEVLDKLARSWWVNSFADLSLADVLKFSAGVGTGYCEVHWDASAASGVGDITLTAVDPRDVIPIRPTFGRSIQEWEGVIVRKARTVNDVRARFPEAAASLVADRTDETLLSRTWGAARRLVTKVMTPVDHLTQGAKNIPARIPVVDVYEVHLKDRRLYAGTEPLAMGDPRTTWSYTVYPLGHDKPDGTKATADDAKLYPNGRLIICSKKKLLYDGPNPYWHGMFPIARLCLDPWPWALLGTGIAHDLIPIQDALNELLNGILDKARQALRPPMIADKRAVPESIWQRLDTRIAGMKLKVNPTAGKGIEFGQVPELPSYVFELLKLAIAEMDNMAGTANLAALTQLQQAPAADSIERMMEALTPILRLRGRLLEAFLREVGEMVKSCFFQFYTMPRRIAILGEAGLDMQDFDFDPGTLVPSLSSQDEGYDPAYDVNKTTRAERAKRHQKNFTFQITPNSLLAVSQLSRKLLYLQLWRGGLMDPWTLFEILEIPNGGAPPSGATTITDRLMEAQLLGLTGQVSPAGRKATGQESPSQSVKPDQNGLPRVAMSESG